MAGPIGLMRSFRAEQLRTRAEFLRELATLWPLLDPQRLDLTAPAWMRLVLLLIERYREQSAEQGFTFYDLMRALSTDQVVPIARPTIRWAAANEAAATSLRVLGPIGIMHRTGLGWPVEKAARTAMVEVAQSASRHVLEGARQAVDTAVRSDDQAIGFARYASGSACAFCKMLAGRGAVYKSRASAGGAHRYHDNCSCMQVPIFSRADPLPPGSEAYGDAWAESTCGLSGKEAVAAFRAHVSPGH